MQGTRIVLGTPATQEDSRSDCLSICVDQRDRLQRVRLRAVRAFPHKVRTFLICLRAYPYAIMKVVRRFDAGGGARWGTLPIAIPGGPRNARKTPATVEPRDERKTAQAEVDREREPAAVRRADSPLAFGVEEEEGAVGERRFE